ncbi:heme exporter protein CcmD [Oceanospirillum linum]|uniref:Heme exporter protein D n=1 Tax=Oceanospirillum linum TaxID=966 RepID=A0A1T1HFP4_OCELI|nr:heme exporter protein CcmD [Oceanospirillum linum]OOV88550.1 heme exporter protein CcmD [Oceanospirillum linum]SEF60461.1 heme exporter protein D [Oleiphilus messinensis]SMP06935.1 heme exporter protein D [Oceanospirillum linum]
MYFDSFSEFLNMGGHGLYVWMAYGLSAVLLIINVVQPVMHKRQLIKEQMRKLRREQKTS